MISSGLPAFRYSSFGKIFDGTGSCLFGDSATLRMLQGYLNSTVACAVASLLSPTLSFEVGQISSFPFVYSKDQLCGKALTEVDELREMSKTDWDSFETSWDFKRHPLL